MQCGGGLREGRDKMVASALAVLAFKRFLGGCSSPFMRYARRSALGARNARLVGGNPTCSVRAL